MTQTVDDLRNEIRVATGRFERADPAAFTKESLAAICDALDYEIDHENYPSKSQMRAGIRWRIGLLETDDPEEEPGAFRKPELESIAAELRE